MEEYLDPEEELQEAKEEAEDNTEAQKKAVEKTSTWFTYDRDAKSFLNDEMDENDKLRNLKHWDLLGPTGNPLRTDAQQAVHPNAIDPIANALIDGFKAEFAQDVDLIDYPLEEGDDEVAATMTDIKQYLAYKNKIQLERLDWLDSFAWHGTGIWKHVFDPTWIGGEGPNRWAGEIRWQSRHPRYVFPDMSCGKDIHQGRRIHDARYVTKEYLLDKYPAYAALVQTGAMDTTLLSDDESEIISADGQAERTMLVETWYIGKPLLLDQDEKDQGKGLHVIWWCDEFNPVYLGHANYLYYKPGVDVKFPFTFSQCYARDGSCWGRGLSYLLKQLQIMVNKVEDVKMEAVVHQTLGQTFFQQGALSPKQQQYVQNTGTLAGNYLEVNDLTLIKRVWGAGIPGTVMDEPRRLQQSMENAIGRYDVSVGRSPVSGSASSFKALSLLDQRAQVRLRPIETVINAAYEEAGSYINRLIWKNYTEERKYRIIGRNAETGMDEVRKRGAIRLSDLRKVNDFRTGHMTKPAVDKAGKPIEVPLRESDLTPDFVMQQTLAKNGGQLPEGELQAESQWQEGTDYELYEPELDIKVRTSAAMPSERFFWIDTAKELLVSGAIDLKIFMEVLERGRFPAWNIVKKAIEERMAQMAAAQPQGQPTQGSGGLPANGRWTYTAQIKDPNLVQAINADVAGAPQQAQPGQPQPAEGGVNPALQELVDNATPEVQQILGTATPEQIQEMNDMSPEQLRAMLQGEQVAGPREWTAKGGMLPAGPGPNTSMGG